MTRRSRLGAALAILLGAALAGCGGESRSGETTGSPHGGHALFVADCGGCHTLAAAGTHGTVGSDLDRTRPGYSSVLERVTNGGDGMPAFAGTLTRSQIRAIAHYVSGAAG